jgi:flavin reductase (DIM6/NTAB) family NADH-FMN oxidoreductase RutF
MQNTQLSDSAQTGAALSSDLRAAMRCVAATVSVVTCAGPAGRFGITATSVTSVCLDPPSVLVCINRTTSLHQPLIEGGNFCIQVLRSDQIEVANAFAGSLRGEARFSVGQWVDWGGQPALEDAQVVLHCAVDVALDHGTHSVVLARVRAVRLGSVAVPLVHHNGAYLQPASLVPA